MHLPVLDVSGGGVLRLVDVVDVEGLQDQLVCLGLHPDDAAAKSCHDAPCGIPLTSEIVVPGSLPGLSPNALLI